MVRHRDMRFVEQKWPVVSYWNISCYSQSKQLVGCGQNDGVGPAIIQLSKNFVAAKCTVFRDPGGIRQ